MLVLSSTVLSAVDRALGDRQPLPLQGTDLNRRAGAVLNFSHRWNYKHSRQWEGKAYDAVSIGEGNLPGGGHIVISVVSY